MSEIQDKRVRYAQLSVEISEMHKEIQVFAEKLMQLHLEQGRLAQEIDEPQTNWKAALKRWEF